MRTNCLDIIEAALARRSANDDLLFSKQELVATIDRHLQRWYKKAAQINPWYFGDIKSVSGTADPAGTRGWLRPTNAIVVTRTESAGIAGNGADRKVKTTGKEIYRVSHRDVRAEMFPKIYPRGRYYYPVDQDEGPHPGANGDAINFYFSKQHPRLDPTSEPNSRDESPISGTITAAGSTAWVGTGTSFTTQLVEGGRVEVGGVVYTIVSIASATALTVDIAGTFTGATAYNVSNELDATWPEDHNDLLILPLSQYFAKKDGRPDDAAALVDELTVAEELFLQTIQLRDFNLKRRWGQEQSVSG